jgi:hypothetical protein
MQTISLEEFPLRWRWTEEEYCLLSDDELSQIAPLAPKPAKDVWETSLKFSSASSDFSPNTDLFINIESVSASDYDTVKRWLSERVLSSEIIVSWQPDLAVLTNTDLFIKYWSEFCYPSSDDVSIWPLDKSWVLHYWHEEVFWYGKSASA